MDYSKYIQLLIKQAKLDQELRQNPSDDPQYFEQLTKLNNKNAKIIDEILNTMGLPTISMVGKKAHTAAFLLVQHSGNLKLMKKYLSLLKINLKDINIEYIALIEDRIRFYEKKPQIYGTQRIINEKTGKEVLYEIDDLNLVNKRRAKIGMEPITASLN